MPVFCSPQPLLALVAEQKQGLPRGIPSLCTANPLVLEACLRQALAGGAGAGRPVLIEATCNQVNQEGGYTGLTPDDFAGFIQRLAGQVGFPPERVILGGDHLGPSPWQNEPAEQALEKAVELVRRFSAAGFTKLHLDASMRLGGDDPAHPLDPELSARRAARLCRAAEDSLPADQPHPVYVLGTEVPVPGGAEAGDSGLQITTPQDAGQAIDLFRQEFNRQGLGAAWERVIALVVQPGVEYSDTEIHPYDRRLAEGLARLIEKLPGLVYEAHSTDYQLPEALKQLVEDHFAILKVGPALTFALREAAFALAGIESEWLVGRPGFAPSGLVESLETAMLANPRDWVRYYPRDPRQAAFARKYSFSDRLRYYWAVPEAARALERLLANLQGRPLPLALLSQYLPLEYRRVREGLLANEARALLLDHVAQVMRSYEQACADEYIRRMSTSVDEYIRRGKLETG